MVQVEFRSLIESFVSAIAFVEFVELTVRHEEYVDCNDNETLAVGSRIVFIVISLLFQSSSSPAESSKQYKCPFLHTQIYRYDCPYLVIILPLMDRTIK